MRHDSSSFEPCPYCLTDVRVTRWDTLLGFATQCPNCGAYSGPRWSVARAAWLIFLSLFINGLVFFLVARPLRALVLLVVFVATVFLLGTAADKTSSEALLNTMMTIAILGPALFVVFEHWRHEVTLQQRPPISQAEEPTYIQLSAETARNEIEIAIYHTAQRFRSTANGVYFLSALHAGLLLLDGRAVELIGPLVIVGFVYSAHAHESRLFAAALLLCAVALSARGILRHTLDFGPLGIVVLSGVMCVDLVLLARLRRIREQIPLPPADHLRD